METVWERRENVQFARNGLGEARKCSEIKWSGRGLETVWERPRNGLGEARNGLAGSKRSGRKRSEMVWERREKARKRAETVWKPPKKNLETVWEPPKTVLNPNPKS